MEKHVEALIKKAAEVASASEAMQFAQAACNAANAMCALKVNRAKSSTPNWIARSHDSP